MIIMADLLMMVRKARGELERYHVVCTGGLSDRHETSEGMVYLD